MNPDAPIPATRHRYNGAVYDPALDNDRLDKQLGRVYALMIGGAWHTLNEIASETSDPEASVSAQLRHLRKPRFGSYRVNKRPRGNRASGLFEYQLLERERGSYREQQLVFS